MSLLQQKLLDYVDLFEHLLPEDLKRFEDIYAENIRFKDPFNDVEGIAATRRIFEHMFETLKSPEFHIHHHALNERTAYIHWVFLFHRGAGKTYTIDGVSQIEFNQDGLVTKHIDYWDASEHFLVKLPLIGRIIRAINNRIRA